ncbi:MAG: hypothetical protein KJO31_13675 [Gammaproteobacteria bacterium]|nr:hypothetical protein [Gammaproteobacteria bacterium]
MIGNIVKRSAIGQVVQAEMYDLFGRQFSGVSFVEFQADLREKNWALLLRDDGGNLCGFSMIHYYETVIDGKNYPIVYSGDTVVDVDSWSDSALSYWWMGTIDYLRRIHGKDRLYWFLLVSGYRTYRFLPVYSECFYPRFDVPTPQPIQKIMHTLATDRFGDQFDPRSGLVRLRHPAILKSGLRGIPENRMADPHIAFFAERNRTHESGDELVCFAELAENRLSRLGRRMWRKGRELVEAAGHAA